jgi:hypothetical protein
MTGSDKKSVRTRPKKSDAYLELVQRFPLKHLRSDRELAAAIEILKSLLIRGDLASGEQDYLDVLTDIVERYERDASHAGSFRWRDASAPDRRLRRYAVKARSRGRHIDVDNF